MEGAHDSQGCCREDVFHMPLQVREEAWSHRGRTDHVHRWTLLTSSPYRARFFFASRADTELISGSMSAHFLYSHISMTYLYHVEEYQPIGIYVYLLIQSIACVLLYGYSQYIRIALYKIQTYSRYGCISWSTQWGARSVYCNMGIALYIGAFAVHLQKSSECISLYHVWLYRTYTLRILQVTDHYQIRCGWMRTRIRFSHRLSMRSKIHQI